MKASMDERGTITIQAETGAEAFALECWSNKAVLPIESLQHAEHCVIRGSMLVVRARVPEPEDGGQP